MMETVLSCPGCGVRLRLPEPIVPGQQIKCPKCVRQFAPAQPAPHKTVEFENETRTEMAGPKSLQDATCIHHSPSNASHADEDAAAPSEFLRPAQAKDELGRLGHFRVLKELGHGGMGAVYLAEDVRLLRQVALKVMLPRYAKKTQAKERFLREARLAASIENDHIIAIHEVDEDHGVPFLTMPVLKGESLQSRLHRDQLLEVPEVLRIGWQICDGLQAAHERELVHRDLKPGNIWLEGVRGRVKILDFGLARAVHTDQHLTGSGVIVGTPAYMAPEQARNPKVDGRADLFSLGVILYRCLVGEQPFLGHDAMSVMLAICNDEPAPPRDRLLDIPLELSNLIMKLLRKKPDDRCASAEEVSMALEAIDRKYFLGQAIPGSSLPPSAFTNIPIAEPIAQATMALSATPKTIVPAPKPSAETALFAFKSPTEALAPVVPPADALRPAQAVRPSKKGKILLAIGLGLFAFLLLVTWQIVIRITDEKGKVREIEVKPGEKLEIIQGKEKKPNPPDTKGDVDRQVAEWVLRASPQGYVRIREVGASDNPFVFKAENLPKTSFSLVSIDLLGVDLNQLEIPALYRLQKLEAFGINGGKGTKEKLEQLLSGLPENLSSLVITVEEDKTRNTEALFPQLSRLKRLKRLVIGATGTVSDSAMTHLKPLGDLEQLELPLLTVSDAGMAEIVELKKIKMLSLPRSSGDATVRLFAEHGQLTRLALTYTNATRASLPYIAKNKNLTELYLPGTLHITDADVKLFVDLTFLKVLGLGETEITDTGFEQMLELKNITSFFSTSSQITDDGLKKLDKWKALTVLLLDGSKITDRGLEHLAKHKKLNALYVRKTAVSEAALRKLATVLPRCTITWDGGVIPPMGKAEKEKVPDPPSNPLKLAVHTGVVHALGFSPDGARLVTGDLRTAYVSDTASGQRLFTLDVKGPIFRASFGAKGQLLTVGNKENTIRLWDAQTGKPLPALPDCNGAVHEAVFTPDGKRLVCFDRSGTLSVFDLAGGKLISAKAAYDPKLNLSGLAISPDSSKVCFATGKTPDWSVKVWDLEAGKETLSWPASVKTIHGVAWSGNGTWIASTGLDPDVHVWHAATGKIHKSLRGPEKTAWRVALDHDGRRVAATYADGVAHVWDVETGKLASQFPLEVPGLGNVAFSPDGRRLAATAPGVVQIRDLPAGPP